MLKGCSYHGAYVVGCRHCMTGNRAQLYARALGTEIPDPMELMRRHLVANLSRPGAPTVIVPQWAVK